MFLNLERNHMKNLSLPNVFSTSMANATAANNKPGIQISSNDQADSFHHQLAHQLDKTSNATNQEKAPSWNQIKSSAATPPDQAKVTDKTKAPDKTKTPDNDGKTSSDNSDTTVSTAKKTSSANKPPLALDTTQTKELNGKETKDQTDAASTLPATPDISTLAATWMPAQPNSLPTKPSTGDPALTKKIPENDLLPQPKARPVGIDEITDSGKKESTNINGDDLASRFSASDLKDVIANKVALHAFQSNERKQDFESALSSSLTHTEPSKESIKDIINPGTFPGKIEPANVQSTAPIASPNTITAYPGKDGWDKAISQKIVWMVGSSEQSASLTLNPPDLGPLQVVIHVHNNQTDATFSSDNKEVRQALEDGMSNLRDMMKDAGITLGQTNINQRNSQQQEPSSYTAAYNNNAVGTVATSQQQGHLISPNAAIRTGLGLVDTFA
jgi:flagellar hook-length control protein FliK